MPRYRREFTLPTGKIEKKEHICYSFKNAELKFAYDWRELAKEHGPTVTYGEIVEVNDPFEEDKPKQLGMFEI